MFDFRLTNDDNTRYDRPERPSHAFLLNQAINLFNQAHWEGILNKAWRMLLGRNRPLFDLTSLPQHCIRSQRHGGLKAISLHQICGTLGRTTDFDAHFRPLDERLRDRWVSIAIARRQFVPLDAVELIQVGDCYFVKDGHHRISVARALGETVIDAEITVWDYSGDLPWETQPVAHALPQTA